MILQDKMQGVLTDVNAQIAEREELVELISIALLTRKNLFILGDPGQAKSYAINLFRQRITGARQFERLLSKQTDEDQLFGRVDLSSLIPGAVPQSVLRTDARYTTLQAELVEMLQGLPAIPDDAESLASVKILSENLRTYQGALSLTKAGEPTVLTAGKIPEADICFLDECFKCNDGVLNSLLTALNERKYTNEGHTYPIPTISFFAASNEIPNFNDPQEKILEALYDRLELKTITSNIADRSNRLAVLKDKQSQLSSAAGASITMEELLAMQAEVRTVEIPDRINELADDILCELRRNGITVSDRKFLNYGPIAQAKAWLEGRQSVDSRDLLALRCYLWQKPADLSVIDSTLQRLCLNPLQDAVDNIRAMAAEAVEDFNAGKQNGNKALVKFRDEFVRLYNMQLELAGKAQTSNETAMVADLLADLEKDNRAAHEQMSFTYTPLDQLAALK